MQFIVENEAFAKALNLVKGSIRQSSIPILCHIAVEAGKDNKLKLRASNLERETEVAIPAEVIKEGSGALPGEVLCAMSRRLSKGGQAEVTKTGGERVKVVSGSSKFDLRYLALDDFPGGKVMGDDAVEFTLPASWLKALLSHTLYAANPKDKRTYCQGPHLIADGPKLVAMATDGLRLAEYTVDLPKGAATMPSISIPIEACQQILDMLAEAKETDSVHLAVSSALLEVRYESARLATALIDGRPIDYKHLIPKRETPADASVKPYALSEAIERTMVVYLGAALSMGAKHSIGLKLGNGAIALDAGNNTSMGLAGETVEAETNGHDVSFRIVADYLAQALKIFPETVTVDIRQAGREKPILLAAPERPEMVHVIMPVVK